MKKLYSYFNALEKGLHILGYIAAFAMMLLITADTAGRFFFNLPIQGTFEITQMYLMVMIIFLSISYSYKNGSHIRIDVLYNRFSERTKLVVDMFGIVLTLVVFSMICYKSYEITYRAFVNNQQTFGVISMPVYLSYIWIPIGTGVLLIRMVIDFVKKVKQFLHFKESNSS